MIAASWVQRPEGAGIIMFLSALRHVFNLLLPLLCLRPAVAAQASSPSLDALVHDIAVKHIDGPDEAALREAAVMGIIQWMSSYTDGQELRSVSLQDYEAWLSAVTGEGHGLGLDLEIIQGYGIRLGEVFPDSPAAEVGLQRGEVIIAIDGQPVAQRSTKEILFLLRHGDERAIVFDVVGTDGVRREYQLETRRYRIPNITSYEAGPYQILRLQAFGPGFARELQERLVSLEGPFILDLRRAGDGLLSEAIAALGPLLGPAREVAQVETGSSRKKGLFSPESSRLVSSIVLLVDEDTHGIAELFAFALRRGNEGTRIIGALTAGVSTLPAYLRVNEDLFLRFPAQRLSLPDGSSWEQRGLVPDVLIPSGHPSLLPPPNPVPDLQLDAAYHLIRTP